MSDRLIGQPESRARGHNRPQQVTAVGGHFVDDISVGSEHTLALTCDGDVWAWGSNSDGQLGLGHTVAVREPQLVGGLGRNLIKQVCHSIVHVTTSPPAVLPPGEPLCVYALLASPLARYNLTLLSFLFTFLL